MRDTTRITFCHPEYAYSMVGYGVDINAPQPPFVLFKVLYRKSALENILAPLYIVARIFLRICAALLGYVMGFFFGEDDGGDLGLKKQPVSRDRRIPRPSWGPDLLYV